MGRPLTKERRFEARRRTAKSLPGRLLRADNHIAVDCKALDVSAYGMGIFSEQELEDGHYLLEVDQQQIELELVWRQETPVAAVAVGYRYGLRLVRPVADFETLFVFKED